MRRHRVAARDARSEVKTIADVVCDGTDDQVEINDAMPPVVQYYLWALRWQEVERKVRSMFEDKRRVI